MSIGTIYYLEMNSPSELRPKTDSQGLEIIQAKIPEYRFNKFLYTLVGESWQWTDKLSLPDTEWKSYVEDPELHTWVAYLDGSIVGYFELQAKENGNTEIVYFGLAPQFIGKGLGGYLLSQAIEKAWRIETTSRLWLHTCTEDHEAALMNYKARGFRLYKEEESISGC